MRYEVVSCELRVASKKYSVLIGAFTLIEMVLALGILGVLMLAGQSAIRIAARSVPSSSSPTYSAGNGQRGLAQLALELAYATSVTSMSSTSVTFTVAARGSDTSPETICYAWDGVAGDPLTRQYNSDAAQNVVTNVNALSLLYDKRSAASTTTYTTSANTTLYSYDNAFLASTLPFQSNFWVSQSFTPSLPSNAATWTVTSVKFKSSQGIPIAGPAAQFYVQIRPSSSNIPGSAALQQTTVIGTTVTSSLNWETVSFATPVSIPAGVQGALSFQWASGPGQVGIDYQTLGSTAVAVAESSNSGTSWTNLSGMAVYCYIYGTYTTPNPTTYNYYLENVRASLQLGSNADATMRTGIPILNQPQVTGP